MVSKLTFFCFIFHLLYLPSFHSKLLRREEQCNVFAESCDQLIFCFENDSGTLIARYERLSAACERFFYELRDACNRHFLPVHPLAFLEAHKLKEVSLQTGRTNVNFSK